MSEFSSKDYANGYRDGAQSAEATITALRAENENLVKGAVEQAAACGRLLRDLHAVQADNEKLRTALESIADLPPGYADMRQDDLVVILANKARTALEEKR